VPGMTAAAAPVPAPPAVSSTAVVSEVVEQEKIHRLIEALRTPEQPQAARELAQRGQAALPALLEALERRDATLRQRAFELLKFVAKEYGPFDYDPDGPSESRLRQVAFLRARLERR
jgi:lipopolysaccharide export system ATP-binding protein